MAIKPINVSQLNNYIGRILQTDPLIGNVSVIGEISNLKYHSSGHIYFSMKDENSTVRCFVHVANAARLRYELKDGMEITVVGYISLFERGGYYSLNIKEIEVEGQGPLAIAFENIKEKLEKEGLFSEKYKKELPFFARKIAIVTSETGDAVKDIITTIREKNKVVEIIVYPVLVQGPYAANEISSAIYDINENFEDVDIIITGRGGGSIEELWAFNEEIVARAIFDSKIPVISSVGHEADLTIADFVADKRAKTPTAAGMMAVPDVEELLKYIELLKGNTYDSLYKYVERNQHRLELLKARLNSLNPKRIIQSGYGAVLNTDRKLVTSVKELNVNDTLTLMMADGEVTIKVEGIAEVSGDE